MTEIDRKTVNILLAALDIEQHELAEMMGYHKGYVANVLNGYTKASTSFREAFGRVLAVSFSVQSVTRCRRCRRARWRSC